MKAFMNIPVITDVRAREILDSKGIPMVEADVLLSDGSLGRGASPCGVSVGRHEAVVLRDGGSRYRGLGVRKAMGNIVHTIRPVLLGRFADRQKELDSLMADLDGTPDKSRLGANAVYSVSIALARAAAASKKIPLYRHLNDKERYCLPFPVFNMLNGGTYGTRRVEMQEFLLVPAGAESFSEAIRIGAEVFYALKDVIVKRYGRQGLQLGSSAGYACPVDDPAAVLELLLDAADAAGHAGRIRLGIDCAASQFYDSENGVYLLGNKPMGRDELLHMLLGLCEKFPMILVEDPFHEDDFAGHAEMTRRWKGLVAGDDLFVTQIDRLRMGVETGAANAVIVKPNMVGTLSEALEAAFFAQSHGYCLIPGGRAGGTVDDPVTDIALSVDAPMVKFGAPRAGEKVNKYNRLLQVEDELGPAAAFPLLEERIRALRSR